MKKINNIKDFLFANNKQYIVERENLIDELGNKISINEHDSIYVSNNQIVFRKKDHFFRLENKSIVQITDHSGYYLYYVNNLDFIIFYFNQTSGSDCVAFFSEGEFKYTEECNNTLIFTESYLFYGDEYPAKKVWCKLLSNFSTKWDISLSDIFLQQSNLEMEGQPLVMNDIVIFPITEGGLIAIDIKSGDLKWHLFDLDRPYQGFVLNDAVCFIGEWFLIEIDLRNGEIMRKVDIRTLSLNYDFNIGLVKLYDNRIYFTDNRNKQIGILDYQTLQLIDLYQLEKQRDSLNLTKLDVVENRIYVLDKGTSSSTLYILEDNNGHLV